MSTPTTSTTLSPFFETEAARWDYKNALTQNNLHPVLLPEHVTDAIFSPMEDISEYEGWAAKLTVTYVPTTQTLHCELCSVLDGEKSPAVTYRFPIPGGQEPEYKVFTESQEFTYQPDPDINNLAPNTAVFLPELSHPAANNRKKILRQQGLYLLAPSPNASAPLRAATKRCVPIHCFLGCFHVLVCSTLDV